MKCMKPFAVFAAILAVGVAAPAVLAATTAPAAAASATNSTSPTNGTSTEGGTYVTGVDSDTRVVGYSYDSQTQTMTVRLESSTVEQVVVSDLFAGVEQEGAAKVPRKRVTVMPGETAVVKMQVTEVRWNGNEVAGVGVSTGGGAVRITHGAPGETSLPLDAVSSPTAWGGGVFLAFSLLVVAARRQLAKESDEPESLWNGR